LYQTLSNGLGMEEKLYESEVPKAPMAWAPDGKRIVFWVQDPKTGGDLWMLSLDGEKKAAPLVVSTGNDSHARISLDGKWIAYSSDSSGRKEIYVQPFPDLGGKWQVSKDGGDFPRWSGKELFYSSFFGPYNPTALGAQILSVPIRAVGAAF